MIATSHVIIGGAVGIATGNPAAALAAGIVSHIICDSIPHFDSPIIPPLKNNGEINWTPGFLAFAIADSLLALSVVLYFWSFDNFSLVSPFAWGAGGGYLPDLIDNLPGLATYLHQFTFFKKFHQFHIKIHETWQKHFPMKRYWPLGIITQLVVALPCLYYIINNI